jgi:hypothetical protein
MRVHIGDPGEESAVRRPFQQRRFAGALPVAPITNEISTAANGRLQHRVRAWNSAGPRGNARPVEESVQRHPLRDGGIHEGAMTERAPVPAASPRILLHNAPPDR